MVYGLFSLPGKGITHGREDSPRRRCLFCRKKRFYGEVCAWVLWVRKNESLARLIKLFLWFRRRSHCASKQTIYIALVQPGWSWLRYITARESYTRHMRNTVRCWLTQVRTCLIGQERNWGGLSFFTNGICWMLPRRLHGKLLIWGSI